MAMVRIEHEVADYAEWKQVFDSDPADREGSGVRRYEVMRPVDDPNYVLVDLEFGSLEEARAFRAKMRAIWDGPARDILRNPRTRIVECEDTKLL